VQRSAREIVTLQADGVHVGAVGSRWRCLAVCKPASPAEGYRPCHQKTARLQCAQFEFIAQPGRILDALWCKHRQAWRPQKEGRRLSYWKQGKD